MPLIKRLVKQYQMQLKGYGQEGVNLAILVAPVRGTVHKIEIIDDKFVAVVEEPADDEAPRKEETKFLVVQPGHTIEFDPELVQFYQLIPYQRQHYTLYTLLDSVG